jgi:hypothetical protein
LCSFLNVKDHFSHPYKTSSKCSSVYFNL